MSTYRWSRPDVLCLLDLLLAKNCLSCREGDISSAEANKYFEGIRQFYEATVKCILEKFPLHDETFMHAKFVDFTRREAAEFRDVEYFVERYGAFLSFTQQ